MKDLILDFNVSPERLRRWSAIGNPVQGSGEMYLDPENDLFIELGLDLGLRDMVTEGIFNASAVLFPRAENLLNPITNFFTETFSDFSLNSYPCIVIDTINPEVIKENNFNIVSDAWGYYVPVLNLIKIDAVKIANDCDELMLSYNEMFEIVLKHEIGHWLSHEILISGEHWNDKSYINETKEVKEFWAQIFGHHLLSPAGRLKQMFFSAALNTIYQNYFPYKEIEMENLLNAFRKRELSGWESLVSSLEE